jgi:hypothetical protein
MGSSSCGGYRTAKLFADHAPRETNVKPILPGQYLEDRIDRAALKDGDLAVRQPLQADLDSGVIQSSRLRQSAVNGTS